MSEHARAGQQAEDEDLVDVGALLDAYADIRPEPDQPAQQVAFGTSGHRGSSLDGSFNDAHIAAITQAVCEHRRAAGIDGPLLIGRDTHALSEPAWRTALEVLAAHDVQVLVDAAGGFTPTPAVSHAILRLGRNHEVAGAVDGIVVTPSHNPPRDGGFKYNPPHGGPAGNDVTRAVAERANELLAAGPGAVRRVSFDRARAAVGTYDFLGHYVDDLPAVLDLAQVREAGVRIGADPMGGASVAYWGEIAERHRLDLTVVNPDVDPQWSFMTLDSDGAIRMDCSSPRSMTALVSHRDDYDVSTGNDADADRHGIVTPDAGLMNPNHYLAVAIEHLLSTRSWSDSVAVGKTLVSSMIIDRVVAARGRRLLEVPVGFKWFVDGLLEGSVAFAGEESAGASFLRRDGGCWTTDKDGLLLALLAAEILAVTGRSPSQLYADLTERFGDPAYARVDAPATREHKQRLASLSAADVTATTLAGDPIVQVLTEAPGNGAAICGVKVVTAHAWFAARPSGTEDVYKVYAESLRGSEHLGEVQAAARQVVDAALDG
ncbi:MAG: phosphoglucomutase (alpha-D-glucose-1,6-bisphosphate-dependent) [Actinomycetota bacterium]|nr:phosphoglucomutase (alpha-D-glucose-1,6-bisphosphate-dependent) [Actinomycetota bacterium]